MTELLKVSPTSLSSFDVDTAFGCKRKWWFKYVMGLREPQSPGAVKGDKVHKVLEALLTRPVEDTQEFDREALYIATSAGEYIEQMRKDGDWHIEVSLEEKKLLPGCVLVGRIDALHSRSKTIRDWKTMKSLQYAKPSMMLDQDLQMQLYAASVADEGEHINIEHINLTTERPYQSLRTFSVSTPEKRAVVLDKALALADGMRIYKTISDVNDTEPDRSKCRFCAFKDRCPTGEKTVNLLNTILGNKPAPPLPASALDPFRGRRAWRRPLSSQHLVAGDFPVDAGAVAAVLGHDLVLLIGGVVVGHQAALVTVTVLAAHRGAPFAQVIVLAGAVVANAVGRFAVLAFNRLHSFFAHNRHSLFACQVAFRAHLNLLGLLVGTAPSMFVIVMRYQTMSSVICGAQST
jgi:CRISPR/Cas system-associated exonuclease Cas4 (RecB family)